MHTLPAGLKDNNGEFFVANGIPSLLTGGRVIDFDHFDEDLKAECRKAITGNSKMVAAYIAMGARTDAEVISKGLVCGWGGFDNKADLVNGKLREREAWPCPQIATCNYVGIGCINAPAEQLTTRQIQIIRLTADGMLDKEIAGSLGISINTVTTHQKKIRQSLGLKRKADIAAYAHQNNLIL